MRWTAIVLSTLVLVLAVHIYVVTRHRVDASTRVMARIDLHQPVTGDDANRITAWLYQQKGVDHVLCNAKTQIVVFTYSPLVSNGNDISDRLRDRLRYPLAQRYVPSQKDLQGSCPVASSSFVYKISSFFNRVF